MLMSYRAYARHRNVTLRAVQKAIESGRITVTADKKIDSDLADKQWEANTDPSRGSLSMASKPTAAPAPQSLGPEFALTQPTGGHLLNRPTLIPPHAPEKKIDEVPAGGEEGDSESLVNVEFKQARTEREKANAAKAQLELAEALGQVIKKDFAVQAVYTAFRALRDAVLNVPARIREEIAAESDSDAVERHLENELTRALASVNLKSVFKEDLE